MKICDHTSVGIFVWEKDKLLLIERKKIPYGFAIPAGHVDGDGSFEEARARELKELVFSTMETMHVTALGLQV
jgi:ADP-ribose pyrophosphatase YjhB (NUDIX family)